tara:strand:- start:774 stop:1208 length:435 start_codon:yes stop_codon:yes gene_type:complete
LIIGYTTGVFDLFHIGHLNILRRAREKCDKLIVGVTTDELLKIYKNKSPIIPFEERISIVKSIKYVDEVVPQDNMDKLSHWDDLKFNVVFVGDDWQNTDKWNKIESDFNNVGVKVVYFPYTEGTSSTLINEILVNERKKLRRSD